MNDIKQCWETTTDEDGTKTTANGAHEVLVYDGMVCARESYGFNTDAPMAAVVAALRAAGYTVTGPEQETPC